MFSIFIRSRIPGFLSIASALFSLASCGGQSKPTDPVSIEIEAFTGGHSKLTWSSGPGDPLTNFHKLTLWGIDTRDGKGVRVILKEKGNYARPMVTPGGEAIVYTNKGTYRDPDDPDPRYFKPVVYRVDWDGGEPRELGKGYAVDVWRDPETGTDWVYVVELEPTGRSALVGLNLERFKLKDPGHREAVWNRTKVGTENLQLSGDGKRASGLFPWPQAGALALDEPGATGSEYWMNQNGCWPSMAPDDSHLAWVFDGSHKKLYLFGDRKERRGVIPIATAPGVDFQEVYHPRWSNDVRFFVMTGPYVGESITRSDVSGVEVYIGRFSDPIEEVEDWLKVTDNEQGDFFPDLWIEPGN